MATPVNVYLSLNEFINFIKALDTAGIVLQHQGNPFAQPNGSLPFELTQEFLKFDSVMSQNNNPVGEHKKQFLKFIDCLIKFAINHNFYYRNAQTAQADYLTAFLLYNNIHISVDNELFSLREIMQARLPQGLTLPDSAACVNGRAFPAIMDLSNHWVAHVQAKQQQVIQAQWLAYRAIHSFDNIVLDLNYLSYAIEGFINTNKIQLCDDNGLLAQKPCLAPDLSQIMKQFVAMARSNVNSEQMHNQLGVIFSIMMKRLIAHAKSPSVYNHAAQQLLGFLLYHDFEIKYGSQQFRISQTVLAEMSEQDVKLWQEHGFQYMPFLSAHWLKNQGYPGKYDLEQLLSMSHSVPAKPVVPYFYQMSQRAQQQSAVQPMQIDFHYRPQLRCR